MAATTSGSVKAYVEGLGLGLPVFRDNAPAGQPLPFVTVTEAVTLTGNQDGDQGHPAAHLTVREDVQVSLWQTYRDTTGKVAETYGLPDTLMTALRRAQLTPVGTRRVYGVTRVSRVRLLEEDANVVHDAITLTVHRDD